MMAHAAALRLRVRDPILVDRLLANYRQAELDSRDRAMLDFAVKLTQTPQDCEASDVDRLRQTGYTEPFPVVG